MRNIVVIDITVAIVVAAIVMIISPGIAVTGLIALLVLVVIGVSFAWTVRHR